MPFTLDNTFEVADLCCCGGYASDGYAAVFGAAAITGYDIDPQPDYPYQFRQADALELLATRATRAWHPLRAVAALHTSFPCQLFTTAGHLRTAQGGTSKYDDLLTPGLALLREEWADVPWVVENVDDNQRKVRAIMAPRPGESLIMLCGSMFGLQVQRHRLFLANFPLRRPTPTGTGVYASQGCRHNTFPIDPISGKPRPWGVWHVPGDSVPKGGHSARDAEHAREVMGAGRVLPWDKAKEGLPPAYTAWIAADLLRELVARN